MIFSLTLDKLLQGFKTQTRRIAKPHEFLVHVNGMWRVEAKTAKRHFIAYHVGRTYSVQPGRGQKAVAYIILRGIREEAVADISENDARAEGFESREDFFATWRAIHGAKADLQQRVWVLEFELLPIHKKTAADDPQIAEKKSEGISRRRLAPSPRPDEATRARLRDTRSSSFSIPVIHSSELEALYGKHKDVKTDLGTERLRKTLKLADTDLSEADTETTEDS